jgi:thiopurine S-methyltransferase
MEHSFWDVRWADGRTGFHQSDVNPTLGRCFDDFVSWLGRDDAASARAIVPLCGKSLDLAWIAERIGNVVGVEFVRSAAQQYFHERGVAPTVAGSTFTHENTSIVVSDFFALTRSEIGSFDLAYDRAALVAIAPERRVEYLCQLWRLLEPGAGVFLISFEHDTGSGPPFSIDAMDSLFDAAAAAGAPFDAVCHEQRDLMAEEPRFRERGASYLREVLWFARRR